MKRLRYDLPSLPAWIRFTVLILMLFSFWMMATPNSKASPIAQNIERRKTERETAMNEYEFLKMIYEGQMTLAQISASRLLEMEEAFCAQGKVQFCETLPEPEPETFLLSRYYTPVPDQERYYRDSYEADFAVNCHGDCFKTACGIDLRNVQPFTVAACPPEYMHHGEMRKLECGTKLDVEGLGVVTCVDKGGAIKGNRLDIYAGAGNDGLNAILTSKRGAGEHLVRVVE